MYIINLFLQLPYGVEVSDSCRDLLLGLLQRDVDKRMSYEHFLQHSFIDLSHKPSSNSLDTAVSIGYSINFMFHSD